MAEAMIKIKDNAHAQQELGRHFCRLIRLALKPLSAKANYLLAPSLRASGNRWKPSSTIERLFS